MDAIEILKQQIADGEKSLRKLAAARDQAVEQHQHQLAELDAREKSVKKQIALWKSAVEAK